MDVWACERRGTPNLAEITAVVICIQTIKAALANPVKSLRSE